MPIYQEIHFEIRDYEYEVIHDPLKHKIRGYYEPMVNHNEQIRKFEEMLNRVRK